MSSERIALGKRGEEIAAKFLKKTGVKILQRNYRCRYGEIDIVAQDKDSLVFIEVKTRTSTNFGTPAMAVDKRKQLQIARAAQQYLADKKQHATPARFDVIAILINEHEQVEHIKNAFDLSQ